MNETNAILDGMDATVCDPETLADLAELFGRQRLGHMLAGLDAEIVQRLESATPEATGLGADTHALVSVSGTLGFMGLSRACMALEQACLDGGDPAAPLAVAQSEARRVRPVIARLRMGEG